MEWSPRCSIRIRTFSARGRLVDEEDGGDAFDEDVRGWFQQLRRTPAGLRRMSSAQAFSPRGQKHREPDRPEPAAALRRAAEAGSGGELWPRRAQAASCAVTDQPDEGNYRARSERIPIEMAARINHHKDFDHGKGLHMRFFLSLNFWTRLMKSVMREEYDE